jgi:hypothetical protein
VELLAPAVTRAGDDIVVRVWLSGASARPIAAFNFDLLYDQRRVRMETPVPEEAALETTGRDFTCNLPPPSADVEPDPATGRARLVCFSFGSGKADGVRPPLTLATVRFRLLAAGPASLSLDAARFFDREGVNLGTTTTVGATVTAR